MKGLYEENEMKSDNVDVSSLFLLYYSNSRTFCFGNTLKKCLFDCICVHDQNKNVNVEDTPAEKNIKFKVLKN